MLRRMDSARPVAALLALSSLLLAACNGGPTGPTFGLDTAFVLTIGESVTLEGGAVRIRFSGVTGDSRCPIDVVCITGGDAIVEIAARSGNGPEIHYDLHTGDLRPVQHRTLTIALVQLAPDPFSTETIPREAYRVALRVTE